MQLVFDITRNFTAIILMVVAFRLLAWAGLCGRAWIDGGTPALEAITKRRVDVVEHEIFAGAFMLCTIAFGAIVQPHGLHFDIGVKPSLEGWVVLFLSISAMLCWRMMHPTLKIGNPRKVILSAAAMAIALGIIYMAPDHRGSGQSGEHA